MVLKILEGLKERISYWKNSEYKESWEELEEVCGKKFSERYLKKKEEIEQEKKLIEKRWEEYTSRKDAWKDQYKYAHRKTILSKLRQKDWMEKAYQEIYGKRLFDFGKGGKMKVLEALFDSENLDEVVRTYNKYYTVKGSLLPKFTKVERYVKNFQAGDKEEEERGKRFEGEAEWCRNYEPSILHVIQVA